MLVKIFQSLSGGLVPSGALWLRLWHRRPRLNYTNQWHK